MEKSSYELEEDLNFDVIEATEYVVPSTRKYWETKCLIYGASNEAMLLDGSAAQYEDEERSWITSIVEQHCPTFQGKRVADLGCGIGRYTAHFVEQGAASVLAVDICEPFVVANADRHCGLAHVECRCCSAFDVELPAGTVDLLFSNWLLMYCPDADLEVVLRRFASWLSPKGVAFFRESCVTSISGQRSPSTPAIYRHPEDYEAAFAAAGLGVLAEGHVALYVKRFNNPNQRYWVVAPC